MLFWVCSLYLTKDVASNKLSKHLPLMCESYQLLHLKFCFNQLEPHFKYSHSEHLNIIRKTLRSSFLTKKTDFHLRRSKQIESWQRAAEITVGFSAPKAHCCDFRLNSLILVNKSEGKWLTLNRSMNSDLPWSWINHLHSETYFLPSQSHNFQCSGI